MAKNTIDVLAKLRQVPPERWVRGQRRNASDAAPIEWLQVARFEQVGPGPPIEIGLSRNAHWVVSNSAGELLDLTDLGDYLPLFPLLELEFEDARKFLAAELTRRKLDPGLLDAFPLDLIAVSALRSRSKFWPDFALKWMPYLPLSGALRDAILFLRHQGRTQNQRHKARQILARIE